MNKMRMLGLALLAIFALGAIAAMSASAALPVGLPVATQANPVKFSDKSGPGSFDGASEVSCRTDTSSGEFLSTSLGNFSVLFERCEASRIACTTLGTGQTSGTIRTTGEFHLVYLRRGTPPTVGIAFLINEVHFECSSLVLVRVRGCAVGPVSPINTSVGTGGKYVVTLKRSGVKNEFTSFLNAAETGSVECKLESALGSRGTFGQSGEETVEEIEGFTQGGSAVSTEIMA